MKKKYDAKLDNTKRLVAESDLKRLVSFASDYYKEARIAYINWKTSGETQYEISYRRNAKKAIDRYHECVRLNDQIKEKFV